MRIRTRVVAALRSTPLRRPTDWILLNVAPGARERRRHHRIDEQTIEFIRSVLPDGASAIDVGAHTGAILKEILLISPSGHHHAVEPLPDLAQSLRQTYPGVVVHECVLGSAKFVAESGGRTVINRNVDDPGYSSVVRESHPRLKAPKVEPVPVTVATLDDIASVCDPLSLVKIDVEGFELEVLRGASRMLATQRPVIVFEHERISSDSPVTVELHSLLTDAGYRIARLIDWRAPTWLDGAAFDASNRDGDSYYIAIG